MQSYSLALLSLAGAMLAGGCANDVEEAAIDADVRDRTPYERLKLAADTSEAFAGGGGAISPIPVQGGQGPADATVEGPLTVTGSFLSPEPGAPPPGSLVLSEYGAGTRVHVVVPDLAPGATVDAVIVAGACETTGRALYTIRPTLRANGAGIASAIVQVPLATEPLLDGEHSVRLVEPGTRPAARVLGCAELPRTDRRVAAAGARAR